MAVTGYIGDAEVTLNNAAEEATMQKILAALGGGGGLGSGMQAADNAGKKTSVSFNKLEKTSNALNTSFKALGMGLGVVTGTFGLLGKAGSGAVKFATGLSESQPTVVDFAKGIKTVTGDFLGLGSALEAVVSLLYKNYTTFQQLSSSGIAFGDRVKEMTTYGGQVGTTLDVVAGNLTKNAEYLGMFGTGTRGAILAIEAQKQAFDLNKSSLQAFGLSFEEQNEKFMSFFSQNAIAMQRGTISQAQVVNLSDDYAKGLRRLSELTGMQSDQIEEGIQKANMNKAFENFMSTMDGETANRMRSIINTAQASFGDGGREAVQAMMLGVAPVTESAQMLSTMMPGFNQQFQGMIGTAQNFSGSLEDFNNNMYGQLNQFANANRGFADQNSKYFATLGMMGDPYGQAGSDIVNFVNRFGGSMEDLRSNLGKQSPTTQAFNTFNEAIAKVRDALSNSIVELLTSKAFQDAMKSLVTNLPLMAEGIAKFLGDMGTPEGRKKRWDEIMEWFKGLMEDLNNVIKETLGGGTRTTTSIAAGKTPIQGVSDYKGMLGFGGLDADRLFEEADGWFTDTVDFLNSNVFGMGRKEWFQKNLKAMMETEQYKDKPEEAKRDLIQAIRDFTANKKESGVYDQSQYDTVMKYITEDLVPIINDIDVRRKGTYGATGQIVEPKDIISRIEKGERVLSPTEARAYNQAQAQGSTSSVTMPKIDFSVLANKLVDSDRELNVKLLNALNTVDNTLKELGRNQKNTISAIENMA